MDNIWGIAQVHVIDVDVIGILGPCQSFYSEKMYFKKFNNDKNPKDLSFFEWNKISPFNKKECQDCIALGSCGGGCPYRAYKNNNDINSIDEIFCIHSKMLIEHLITYSYFNTDNAANN